jgi:hypothetical protein
MHTSDPHLQQRLQAGTQQWSATVQRNEMSASCVREHCDTTFAVCAYETVAVDVDNPNQWELKVQILRECGNLKEAVEKRWRAQLERVVERN